MAEPIRVSVPASRTAGLKPEEMRHEKCDSVCQLVAYLSRGRAGPDGRGSSVPRDPARGKPSVGVKIGDGRDSILSRRCGWAARGSIA